jgi:hypothetical protein
MRNVLLLLFLIYFVTSRKNVIVTENGSMTEQNEECLSVASSIYLSADSYNSKKGLTKAINFCSAGGSALCLTDALKAINEGKKRANIGKAESYCMNLYYKSKGDSLAVCLANSYLIFEKDSSIQPPMLNQKVLENCVDYKKSRNCFPIMFYHFRKIFTSNVSIQKATAYCKL